jgi:hypothetical protein
MPKTKSKPTGTLNLRFEIEEPSTLTCAAPRAEVKAVASDALMRDNDRRTGAPKKEGSAFAPRLLSSGSYGD